MARETNQWVALLEERVARHLLQGAVCTEFIGTDFILSGQIEEDRNLFGFIQFRNR